MKRTHWKLSDLVLCRSDTGDGGWSLHAPWATDDEIASGDEPYLRSGPATWDKQKGEWDRPNTQDRQEAMNVLSARDKAGDGFVNETGGAASASRLEPQTTNRKD